MAQFPTGTYRNIKDYKAYFPKSVNFQYRWSDPQIDRLLAEASRYLGELNAYSTLVPDVDYFIKMHVAKEANASSCTERIYLTMDETVSPESEVKAEKRMDWQEVKNYITAINEAITDLKDLPLSMRLLNKTHAKLLDSVRGYSKTPGKIRTSQNWIGPSLPEASYVPPPPDQVAPLLSDLEKYWHNRNIATPDLIRIAISHYQFETVHPYLDGNGRIGRLIVPLHLVSLGILEKPSLYLSDYLERNKTAYVDTMTKVRRNGAHMDEWITFFLTGVVEISRDSRDTLKKIVDLRHKYESIIETRIGPKRQRFAKDVLLRLFAQPIFAAKDLQNLPGLRTVSIQTAHNLVDDFQNAGLLEEITGLKSNKRYVLKEYFDLFRKK